MGHSDTGGNVFGEEQLLHRHLLRLELLQQLHHVLRNLTQPDRERQSRRGSVNAVLHQPHPGPVRLDEAEADGCHAGINAQNPHGNAPS